MATATVRRRRRKSVASASPPKCATPQAAKGALLIPAFAVERTQELIVDLVDLMERGEVPAAPIFLDSPWRSARPRCFASTPQASIRRSMWAGCSTPRNCGSPRRSTKASRSPN